MTNKPVPGEGRENKKRERVEKGWRGQGRGSGRGAGGRLQRGGPWGRLTLRTRRAWAQGAQWEGRPPPQPFPACRGDLGPG